ncbi:hypothetical protein EVAR_29403_1 [Eumeta japonica]|uniref:Uncharacterized protein n=1 Tax=Eumeta variegata TaxID=151549 RepID=A0A4C1VSG1_EUMVA|nr:hypothetical protein EVAR_29403_1 [Eumeta japonica]
MEPHLVTLCILRCVNSDVNVATSLTIYVKVLDESNTKDIACTPESLEALRSMDGARFNGCPEKTAFLVYAKYRGRQSFR